MLVTSRLPMFGIGLPELILIMALALIVVGPDKLPDLARSVAKTILDLKKTANTLKESLSEEGNLLDEIKPEIEEAAKAIKDDVLGDDDETWTTSDRKRMDDSLSSKEDSPPIIDVPSDESTEKLEEKEEPNTAGAGETSKTTEQQD